MNQQRVTIEDVARQAGFSRATISRVLNNEQGVRRTTVEKVKAVVEALGYTPNAMASALSGGRTRVVAVLLPDIASTYYSSLLEGIDRVAQERGYHVVLKTRQNPRSALGLIDTGMVDGFIIRHSRLPEGDATLLARLKRKAIPFIFIGQPAERDDSPAVMVDNVGGARDMAHHFVDHGFRSILFISGEPGNLDSNDRAYGFRVGLSEKGFDLGGLRVAEGDFSRERGYALAAEILPTAGVEAVFAANDRTALGVLLYCHEHGIRVPEDLAIAGFDDTVFAEFLWPPLTTVRQPMRDIGGVAMERMIAAIEGIRADTTRIILPTRLVCRKSCGCGGGVTPPGRAKELST